MNRPASVTQGMIDAWEYRRQRWLTVQPEGQFYPAEAYYAGCYLEMVLKALGCSPEQMNSVAFALGQRQAGASDSQMWAITEEVVEEYKRGGFFSSNVKPRFEGDPVEYLKKMAANVSDKGLLFESLMLTRFVKAYGHEESDDS